MSQLIKVFDSKNWLENTIFYFIHGLVSSLRGSVLQFHDPRGPNSQRQMAAISALQVCSSPLSVTGMPLTLAGRPHWIKTLTPLFIYFGHLNIKTYILFKSRSMRHSAMNAPLMWGLNSGSMHCEIEPCIHDQGCDPVSLYYQALSHSAWT